MKTRPITVAETAVFVRQAGEVWSDEERLVFVDFIARNPEAGDPAGSGKSGGVGKAAASGAAFG